MSPVYASGLPLASLLAHRLVFDFLPSCRNVTFNRVAKFTSLFVFYRYPLISYRHGINPSLKAPRSVRWAQQTPALLRGAFGEGLERGVILELLIFPFRQLKHRRSLLGLAARDEHDTIRELVKLPELNQLCKYLLVTAVHHHWSATRT